METKKKFTPAQIQHWKYFEQVRAGGRFNMYDPNARLAAGLTEKQYVFCMDNYSELKEKAKES